MNHLIEINDKRYVIRQYPQKLVLFTFPELVPIQKHYISISYSYLNADTNEVLVIYQNQISIVKPAIIPLQLVNIQQSFIDWEPIGGILMRNSIVLYGLHAIIFYTRSNIMEKSWQIDIVQQIEDIKSSLGDFTIGMKVKFPKNTLFLWNMGDLNIKPTQQIILTQQILQWQFIKTDILAILTPSQFRIYVKNNLNQFNLHHFYLLALYLNFCWVGSHNPSIQSRLSVNNVILLGKKGQALLVQLFQIQKRTQQSQYRQVGKIKLDYKGINMKRIVGAWGQSQKLAMLCETKNHHLFGFQLSSSLYIENRYINQQLLGAQITQIYCKNNLIFAKDRTRWKYYLFQNNNDFKLIDQVDSEKAFIGTPKMFCYISKQSIFIRQVGIGDREPFPLKYTDPTKVHLIQNDLKDFYFVIGIRFYRVNTQGVNSIGFALRNQKAVLLQVNRYPATLVYKVGEQYLLLHYKIASQKVIVSTIKSSSNICVGIRDGGWIQPTSQQIKLGNQDKIIAVFPLNRLYKMLDAEDKNFDYSISSIYGGGIALVVKNYVFFLQLVDDEKGCQLVLLKKNNNLLYRRFDPQAVPLKLVDPSNLSFWVGNSFYQLGCRINPGSFSDPFSLPDTLLAKQLDLRKVYPPHHPKILQSLLQSSKIQLILQILHRIYAWFATPEKTLKQLYRSMSPESILQYLKVQNAEDNISMFSEKSIHEETQFLDKFANQLLQNIEAIQLKQKNPFLFQSFLEALSYYLKNSRSVDYFSQAVLIGRKTPSLKGKAINSMHIAYLHHSLNKQQAIAQLLPEKISWEWMKTNSVILWYDNKETIRKWVQQIALTQYRNKKQPFDCLFWYLLAGKRSLLITLFKNHRMDSKEHDAIFNFLQRDFNQSKDRTAAIKNAYVLIDKKRYFHALAFFILGNGIDDCIRLCVDRLKDLNLAYLFCILFKQVSPTYLLGQLLKGDAWTKHLANKFSGKHILSYNCLFQTGRNENWSYEPQLAGFHPSIIDFSIKIKNSVAFKRELQIQNSPPVSQDIFSDFYQEQTKKPLQQPKQKVNVQGDPLSVKTQSIHFYLKQGLPLLGLLIDKNSSQAKQAYQFTKYKLSGEVQGSMQQIVFGLEDKVGIVKCYLVQRKITELIAYIKQLTVSFIEVFKNIIFLQVIRTKKQSIGELLHYGYYTEQLVGVIEKQADLEVRQAVIVSPLIKNLTQLVLLSKIYASIILKYYDDLIDLLETVTHKSNHHETQYDFWKKIKGEYDNLYEPKKEKFVKQMDNFQHAFINIKRKQDDTDYRMDMQIQTSEAILLCFRFIILNFLSKSEVVLKKQITITKNTIESYLMNWASPSSISSIMAQFKILLREGTQSKYKLPLLKAVFDKEFIHFYDIVALTNCGYFQESCNPYVYASEDISREFGIQVFRNKQDGVRSFIINKHESKGLQCIVMFKKGLKKIQVCQNLAKRERTKDYYSLLTEDNFYNNLGGANPTTLLSPKNPPIIQQALINIIQTRKIISAWEFPRKHSSFNQREYIRQIQPPYLDYNELNSILCHPYLPFFLIGGKGNIQLANIHNLKNFDRIKCPGLNQIIKLYSSDQRVAGVDLSGSLGIYNFDAKYTNACVFSLKKTGIIDFCFVKPSVVATITAMTVQIYDTLLHPNRQVKFKQSFTKQSISVSSIGDKRIALLRKNEVLTYDIRMQRLQSTRDLKGKGKSLFIQNDLMFVGMSDSKVKIFNTLNDQKSDVIKLGNSDEKDRQKISVDQIRAFEDITLALNSEGSIYYLPRLK